LRQTLAFFEGKSKEQLAILYAKDKQMMLKEVKKMNEKLKYKINSVDINNIYGPQLHYKAISKATIDKLKSESFLPSVAKMGITRELNAAEIKAYKNNPQ